MERWVLFGVAVGGVVLGGCGTELTSAGANVRVGRATPTDAVCNDLGIIYSSASGDSAQEKLEASQNDLRNKAAALGGNFVLMDMGASDRDSMSISGHALSCSSGDPSGAVVVAPAATEFAVDAPAPSGAAASAAPPSPAQTPEQRLRAIDDLHQKGLLSDAEYQDRRKRVLDGL